MSTLLRNKMSKRQEFLDAINQVIQRASDDGDRDLTAAELTVVTENRQAVEAMAPEIAEFEKVELARSESERLRGLLRTIPQGQSSETRLDRYTYRSGAQFVLDRAAVVEGNRVGAPADYVRAAQERLERADQTTSDNPGLIPLPVAGSIMNFIDTQRPIVVSSSRQTMPAHGSSFTRPYITQHVLAGGPKAELVVGVSRELLVANLTVTKGTYGGWLNLSREDIDWSEPSILDAVYQDLQAMTGLQTEAVAAALLATVLADATRKVTLAAGATSAAVTTAIYTAAALVYGSSGRMPDTIYAAVDTWARLGGLSDTTGRPLFPTLSPNAGGSGSMDPQSFAANPFGMKLVVSPVLAAGTLIVGVSQHLETYDSSQGFQQTVMPSANGFQVAFWATYANLLLNGTKSFAWLAP